MYQSAINTYQQSVYHTASPAKLVLMCYEGALSNLKLAKDAYIAKDFNAKGKALQKTFDIIYELNASLDLKKGGVVASNLRAIYMYLIQSLTEADLKRDIAVFDQSIGMIEELAMAWRAIATPAEAARPESAKPLRISPASNPHPPAHPGKRLVVTGPHEGLATRKPMKGWPETGKDGCSER